MDLSIMLLGVRKWLPHLPHRTIQKNVITVVLTLPVVAVILLLVYKPLDSLDPVIQNNFLSENLPNKEKSQYLQGSRKFELHKSKNYTIHVWQQGERMKRRFMRSYGSVERDPYEFCSVQNCILSTKDSEVTEADAVLFHLHQTKGPHTLPKYHPPNQTWIFFTDESPYHTFLATRDYGMKDYDGLFNWSMTYRADSDVSVPYGRTVHLTKEERSSLGDLPNYGKLKKRTVAILGSNCGGKNYRWNYVKELQKYIQVDIYGNCGNFTCPGHFMRDCPVINQYKFYLAFENSNCQEYITEKLWWNAYHKESVPIVMGASKEDYERLCPPKSLIHVDDFDSPLELADYLDYLNKNDTAYNQYFNWKKHFKVLNEHGYFGSPSLHLCRICEALNTKSMLPKIYYDLDSFWSSRTDCFAPSWIPKKHSKKKKL